MADAPSFGLHRPRSVRVAGLHAADAGILQHDQPDHRDDQGHRAIGEHRPLPGYAEAGCDHRKTHEDELPNIPEGVVGAERGAPAAARGVGAGDQR